MEAVCGMNHLDDEDLEGMSTVDDLEAHEASMLEDMQPEWQPSDDEVVAAMESVGMPRKWEPPGHMNEEPPHSDAAPPTIRDSSIPLPTSVEEINSFTDEEAIRRDRIAYRSDSFSRAALGVALVSLFEGFLGKTSTNDTEDVDFVMGTLMHRGLTFGESARVIDIYRKLST